MHDITSKRLLTSIAILFTLVALFVWWFLEPYQSHYLLGLRFLGDHTTQNLFGIPKEGRGDEWSTYIPFLKQAALEGFPARSSLAPYYERFNWFINIPKADFSLFFLPNNLAYFIFSPGRALSFQAFYYYSLAIASLLWYLRNLKIPYWLGLSAAISIVFSHFYQVWWTSNFPLLASCFLPFAILTSGYKTKAKSILLLWSIGHLAFGQMYPPFYIAIAAALLPFTYATRPDLFTLKQITPALIAAIIAIGCYYVINSDFIHAIQNTSYPGRRMAAGGGSSWLALLGIILPMYQPTPLPGADEIYELSVIGTIFPLIFLAILPWIKWDKAAIRVSIIVAFTLSILSIYAIYGFPLALAKYSGLSLVPGRRLHIGISALVNLYAVYMLSKNSDKIKLGALVTIFLSYAWLSSILPNSPEAVFLGSEYYAYAPLLAILIAIVSLIIAKKKPRYNSIPICKALVFSMAALHVITFGSFNPVMRGRDIMTPVDTQVTRDWKALYARNGEKPFAISGSYGHLLRGEGLAALEAIHLVNVDFSAYQKIFPYLSPSEIENQFNRFVGISFDNVAAPEMRGLSAVFPLMRHAVLFPHRVSFSSTKKPGNRLTYDSDTFRILKTNGDLYDIAWSGVLDIGISIDAPLTLILPCEVYDSKLTRGPIPGDPTLSSEPSLRLVDGIVEVKAETSKMALTCTSKLGVYIDTPN